MNEVFLPHLADAIWATGLVARHAGNLAILGAVGTVRLLDARLTHPHRPGSPAARGWATYDVATAERPVQLYVKGFPDATTAEAAAGQDPRATWLRDEDVVVWRFPDDPRLRTLPTLVDPEHVGEAMPDRVRAVVGDEGVRPTVVRYQPEASATLRVDSERSPATTVFAKNLAGRPVEELGSLHHALWSRAAACEHLRVAEPLGVDVDRSVLWTRGVPGPPLTSALPPSRLPDVAGSIGALLAELHASPVDVPERLTVDDLLVEIGKKADKLSRAHPPVEEQLSDLVAATRSRRAEVRSERRQPLHGDFHLDQLVASPSGPVLVDLDSMVTGAPELDLAEFLVDLALRGLPEPVVRDVGRTLLRSYVETSGSDVDAALLAICADAEFVNRCYRKLRHHAPGWQVDLEQELARHDAVRGVSHLAG